MTFEIRHRDGHVLHVDHTARDLRGAVRDALSRRVDLSEAQLDGADLHNLNFEDARLAGASLVRADLRSANLEDAVLMGADLTDARLDSANLEDADLSDA